MGCGSSKQQTQSHELPARRPQGDRRRAGNISAPTGGPILVPPTQRDASGRPIQHAEYQLSSRDITNALQDVAHYLQQQGASVDIVAVGGAVNTILLGTRRTTGDLDFFHADSSSRDHDLINAASRYAIERSQVPLGDNWLNNTNVLMIPRALRPDLVAAAVQQNEIVFQRPGLTIRAAPWSFAFCAKLDRMHKRTRREHDIADAVVYLHRYLQRHGLAQISIRRLKEWAQRYGAQATDAVLREVDDRYFATYGGRVIAW